MSRKVDVSPQQYAASRTEARPRKPDERIRQTHQRLGRALVELIQEKPIDQVTVQDVLDRASVGRSTFYLHFRDKNDLLLSQLEMVLEHMSTVLRVRQEVSDRVVAVTEIFEHIGGQNKIYRALGEAGRLHDFFDLAQDYFARGIEQRLRDSKRAAKIPQRELRARAQVLAGSLLSLLRWWIDRGAKESPSELDELFHRMVWNGMR
jgi:AcrR family transcriptional regulator